MTKKRFSLGVVFSLLSWGTLKADPVFVPALTVSPDARTTALGGAVTASPEGAESLMVNPAAPATLETPTLTLSRADYLDTLTLNEVMGAFPQKGWVLGLGLKTYSAGTLPETSSGGEQEGTFSPKDLVGVVNISKRLLGNSFGISGKYIQSTLKEPTKTMAFDFGFLSDPLTKRKIRFGLSALNLGEGIKYNEKLEPLASEGRGGVSIRPIPRISVSADIVIQQGQTTQPAFGAEAHLVKTNTVSLLGRAGYNNQGSDLGSGFSAGVGLTLGIFSVNYSFAPMGDLGDTHRLSLSWKGPEENDTPPQKRKPNTPRQPLKLGD